MLRIRLVVPMALMMLTPALAMAAGRPVAETCINAGYRAGSAAFDMCVARIGGDDPLAALEGGELSAHADKSDRRAAEPDPLAAITPARPTLPTGVALPTATREELPASFNTPTGMPQSAIPATPSPAPSPTPWNQGGTWPTPPTAPTFPAVTAPTPPWWNFGSQ